MKKSTLLLLTLVICGYSFAQKPKKTHNHEAFAKKAVMSMAYIEKMCPNDDALSYMSEKSGLSLDELKARQPKNLASLKEDIKFIMDNGIYGSMDGVELTNIRETPVKMADIVVNYTNKTGKFQFILTNCVQTNISWYLGDRIDAQGEGISGLIALRAEKKEKAETGFLGKLKELDEKQDSLLEASDKISAYKDSLNNSRAGYVATTFPMKGIDRSTKYYNYEWTDMPLSGYYVLNDGTIVDAIIAYRKPEFMVGSVADVVGLFICNEANGKKLDVLNVDNEPNFKKFIPKSDIQAFYVGEQLFANIPKVGWRILLYEGAIRRFATIEKIGEEGKVNYQAFEQAQKLNGTALGSIISSPSKNVILDMMEDSPELQEAYKNDTYTQFEAIIRFNYWYDLSYPEKVKYFTTK